MLPHALAPRRAASAARGVRGALEDHEAGPFTERRARGLAKRRALVRAQDPQRGEARERLAQQLVGAARDDHVRETA